MRHVTCPHCDHVFDDCDSWEEDTSPGEECTCGGFFTYRRTRVDGELDYEVEPTTEEAVLAIERQQTSELDDEAKKLLDEAVKGAGPKLQEAVKDGYALQYVPMSPGCPGPDGESHAPEGLALIIGRDAQVRIAYWAVVSLCPVCRADEAIMAHIEDAVVIKGKEAET